MKLTDAVEWFVRAVERHIVSNESKMSFVHVDPVRFEDSADLAYDGLGRSLDPVVARHLVDVVAI